MGTQKPLERCSPEQAGISSRQVERCILELMHEHTQMHGFMASRHGRVFAECWWAPYGPEIVHSNHSFGKSYTATAIGIAMMEGKVSLDEKMVDIFQKEIEEEGMKIPELMKQTTIRHVLTMTNGHAVHPSMEGDWIRNYFETPMRDQPGTRFMYNTSGACMLSAVIKKKTGENLKEYLTPRLFNKIGIDAKRFVWLQWPNGLDAEPGTFATTEDNLRLAILYANGGSWEGEQLVDESFIKEALSVQVRNEYAPEQKDGRCGYGYQLWACSIPGVYRFDGGQGQYGIIWPEKELCIAVHEGGVLPYGPQKTLDILYDELINQLDDDSLPEDPAAYAGLLQVEAEQKVERDKPNQIVPEVDLSGDYQMTEGDMDPWMGLAPPGGKDLFAAYRNPSKNKKVTDFSLRIEKRKCVFNVNGESVFIASVDGEWIVRETGQVFSQLRKYCATARFLNPYTLEIRIHWLNSWTETKLRFEYQQESMKIITMKLRRDEESNWLVYYGKARRKE